MIKLTDPPITGLEYWFRKNYPGFPLEHVEFCENTAEPQKSLVRVLYKIQQESNRVSILGLIRYDVDGIGWDVPEVKMTACGDHFDPFPLFWYHHYPNETKMDDFINHIHWILGTHDTPAESLQISWLLLKITWILPEFRRIQLEKEEIRFKEMFKPSETAIASLLKANGLNLETVVPTLDDRRRYLADTWYLADISEVSTELCKTLPLYKGGKFHISYRDIPEFLWRKTMLDLRKFEHVPIPEQLETLLSYIISQKPAKKPRKTANVPDIEDLDCVVPPCMRHLSFKDQDRQNDVRILARSGYSLSAVEKFLLPKHLHDGKGDMKLRWDYVAHYEKGYAPPNCDRMPTCPFQGNQEPCREDFGKHFPNKRMGTFYGPQGWFYWVHR